MAYTLEARENSKLTVAAEMLRCHGTVKVKAWGMSMLPSVWPGDLLTIEGLAHDQVVPGDIVLVVCDDRFFVHRLVEKEEVRDCSMWVTRGDAMPQNDPPASASELLGRVVSVRRGSRSFVPNQRVSPLHFLLARMLCRWDRFRSLALRIHATRLEAGTSKP